MIYKKDKLSERGKRCLWASVVNFFKLIWVLIIVLTACFTVGLTYFLEKVWTRGGRAKDDEFFIQRLFKSFLAFFIIVLMGVLMLSANSLSFISRKLSNCRKQAKKEGKKIKEFLSTSVDICILTFFSLFSGAYDLSCSLWDRLDGK